MKRVLSRLRFWRCAWLRWRAGRAEARAARTLVRAAEARARFNRAVLADFHFRRGSNGAAPLAGFIGLFPVSGPENRRATHALLDVVVPDHMAAPSRVDQPFGGNACIPWGGDNF